jgi:hypothetical protein
MCKGENMKQFFGLLILLSFNVSAWDFTFKTDFSRSSTNNVNSANSNLVSDTYSDLTGAIQAKNEFHKIKIKLKMEKFQTYSDNDFLALNLGYTYFASKSHDYYFEVFNQKYHNVSVSNSDTASDNRGIKVSTTFSDSISKDENSYLTLMGTYKEYTKIASRKDSIIDSTFGYEKYVTSTFSLNPELNLEYNNSKDSYYSNFNIGPSIYLNFNPNDNLEFSVSGNLIYTAYSHRTFQQTNNARTLNIKENQSLFSNDFSVTYTFFDKLPVQLKYSTVKNSSNNSASAYATHVTAVNFGFKF